MGVTRRQEAKPIVNETDIERDFGLKKGAGIPIPFRGWGVSPHIQIQRLKLLVEKIAQRMILNFTRHLDGGYRKSRSLQKIIQYFEESLASCMARNCETAIYASLVDSSKISAFREREKRCEEIQKLKEKELGELRTKITSLSAKIDQQEKQLIDLKIKAGELRNDIS